MKKRVLSMLIALSLVFAVIVTAPINAIVTQPIDEFTPYRESEHFLFDVPSSFLTGNITPEQLGWYLSEMDRLYEAMADFVGGKNGWLPIDEHRTGDIRKVLIKYEPNIAYMNAVVGRPHINFGSGGISAIVNDIRQGQICWDSVHELGHNFGKLPNFNVEWIADFLGAYAILSTQITLVPYSHQGAWQRSNDGTFDSWYQAEYNWQARTDVDWEKIYTIYDTRYGSILNCAILDFVRDNGWEIISQAFGSYHDGSYPYDGKKYGGSRKAILFNEFIDRIDYFGNVDFRSEYLDNEDWIEYINGLFPVASIGYVKIGGQEYATHTTNLQLNGQNLIDHDIEVLDQMTNLGVLNLRNNQITNILPLNGMTSLVNLSLDNNQLNDLSPLKGMTNLRTLNLINNKITDLEPLYGMGTTAPEHISVRLNLTDNPISLTQIEALRLNLPERAVITHNATEYGCNGCMRLPDYCVCTLSINVVDSMVEIYNRSSNSVSTRGLYLVDDNSFNWQISAMIIRAGEVIRVEEFKRGNMELSGKIRLMYADELGVD